MSVEVDITDLERRVFRVRQTIPVDRPGTFVLHYPRWIPGHHGPTGPLLDFAGLVIRAAGRRLPWTRDPSDPYAFRIEVPSGVSAIQIDEQYLSPTDPAQGPVAMSREIVRLNWNQCMLYPAGYFTRRIAVDASIKFPAGWVTASALEIAAQTGASVRFKRVSFETLVDSPVIAGKYFRKHELSAKGRSRVTLNVVADEPEDLEAKPQVIELHRALVREADLLYGARHFDHYDFLLTLSDNVAGMGLEHHRSSDNGTPPKYFTSWDKAHIARGLLAHEYNHSWCGKYRRPAELWSPDLNTPIRDSLLWVYEGQTQYFGSVLAARAGLFDKPAALDLYAQFAALMQARVGRRWRPLQDTTQDPLIAMRRPIPWPSWQRSEDYYVEGALLWLEIDTLIRERSKERRSLDDFARAFFGMNDGDWGVLTYGFDDIVQTLHGVEPYDWAELLHERLESVGGQAPLMGLKRGGYELVFNETPNILIKDYEEQRKWIDLTYSLGFVLEAKGGVVNVQWDSPAYKAGLTSGAELVAVNGTALDPDKLRDAVARSKRVTSPIELLVQQGDRYRMLRLDYHDGLRYPHLQRIANAPARLDAILSPKAQEPTAAPQ